MQFSVSWSYIKLFNKLGRNRFFVKIFLESYTSGLCNRRLAATASSLVSKRVFAVLILLEKIEFLSFFSLMIKIERGRREVSSAKNNYYLFGFYELDHIWREGG